MKFFTRHTRPKIKGESNWTGNGADQSFQREADINHIMAKYKQTGYLVNPGIRPTRQPFFGDVSMIPTDFIEAQNAIVRAKTVFEALPSALRSMFENSPAALMEWLEDENNHQQAREWGLLAPLEGPPSAIPSGDAPVSDPVEKLEDPAK